MAIAPPSPTYVGPPKWHGGSNNKPITRIVVHCTVGAEPGAEKAAMNTVNYSKNTARPSSFHYIAEDNKSYQYTYDSVVAYHAPPNGHSLGYELCCSLSDKGKGHFSNTDHREMLRVAAKDIAQLCLAYDLPIRKLSAAQVKAGAKGICGHIDVSNAFHQSSHWDPGPYFPWASFITMVKQAAEEITKKPIVKPASSHDVKFRHCSMQFSDTPAQKKRDTELIFSSSPHVITFTEVGRNQNEIGQKYIKEHAGDYHLHFDGFDAGLAIKKTLGTFEAKGYVKVLPGVSGDHPQVGIAWMTVKNADLGRITVASTHYITKDGVANRKVQNNKIATALQALADEKAAGSGLFFFGADTNRDDATQDVVPNTRLTTCWDELQMWPDTLKSVTFDVLGSFDDDARVRVVSARTLISAFNTDHKPIEALYNIKEL